MGMVILIMNLIGLFCTFGGIFSGMIVYSSFILFVSLGIIISGSYVSRHHEKIRKDLRKNFRKLWVIGGIEHYTTEIERNFGCCGWSNVFDYCRGNTILAPFFRRAQTLTALNVLCIRRASYHFNE